MYKHILIPTDGSPLSRKAIEEAVSLAKALGGRVTGITVIPEFDTPDAHRDFIRAYGQGWTMPGTLPEGPPPPPATADEHEQRAQGMAAHYLGAIETAANSQDVPYEGVYRIHGHPYEAIIETARNRGCDLIAMASHGWRGVKGIVLGSETHKVITHGTLPVLVLRSTE